MAGTPPVGPPDVVRDLLAHAKTHGNARQITLPASEADITALVNDLAAKVPQTRTVNGHALSGDVTLAKGDIGLGNVTNTADTAKPVSTAQQTALDLKQDKAGAAYLTVDVVGNLPVAAVGQRGKMYLVAGGAGAADIFKICVKKSDDSYAWLTVTIT